MNDSLALAQAIKEVTESMIANDKSILDLCKVMADKIQLMERRLDDAEQSIIGYHLQIKVLQRTVQQLDQDVHASSIKRD